MSLKKIALYAVFGFCLIDGVRSQETHGDAEFWFFLLNNYQINEKWSVGNELHVRQTNFLSDPKQFLLRPFVNYKPGESVVYSLGYSFIQTHPYGKYPLPDVKPEHNFWEQITLIQGVGKTKIAHRYRMEHRYQGNLVAQAGGDYEVEGFKFSNRFRYRLTLKKPIGEQYFMHLFDELWITLDDKFRQASYNQNWIYLGVGRKIAHGNVQLAYLHQHASSGGVVERHPTLQFTIQYDFNKE